MTNILRKYISKQNLLIFGALAIAVILPLISHAYGARVFTQGVNGSCPSGYTQEYVDGGVTCGLGPDSTCSIGSIVCIADSSSGGGSGGSFGPGSVSLTASPSSIDQGASSTLSWSGANLVSGSCAGTGFTTFGATSGSKIVSPSASVTYSITCDASAGGTVSDSATLTVNQISNPEEQGGGGGGSSPACSNGTDDDGDGDIDYPEDLGCISSLGESEGDLSGQCVDGIDNNSNSLIDRNDPSCSFAGASIEGNENLVLTADRTLVPKGQSATLTWAVQDVTGCTLTSFGTLTGTSGSSVTGAINTATTYTLSCLNLEGDPVSTSVTVKLVPRFREE